MPTRLALVLLAGLVSLAPALAAHMPALLSGDTPPELTPYALTRFPGFQAEPA